MYICLLCGEYYSDNLADMSQHIIRAHPGSWPDAKVGYLGDNWPITAEQLELLRSTK